MDESIFENVSGHPPIRLITDLTDLGRIMKLLRETKTTWWRKSLKETAALAGLSKRTLAAFEAGDADPYLSYLLRLCISAKYIWRVEGRLRRGLNSNACYAIELVPNLELFKKRMMSLLEALFGDADKLKQQLKLNKITFKEFNRFLNVRRGAEPGFKECVDFHSVFGVELDVTLVHPETLEEELPHYPEREAEAHCLKMLLVARCKSLEIFNYADLTHLFPTHARTDNLKQLLGNKALPPGVVLDLRNALTAHLGGQERRRVTDTFYWTDPLQEGQ